MAFRWWVSMIRKAPPSFDSGRCAIPSTGSPLNVANPRTTSMISALGGERIVAPRSLNSSMSRCSARGNFLKLPEIVTFMVWADPGFVFGSRRCAWHACAIGRVSLYELKVWPWLLALSTRTKSRSSSSRGRAQFHPPAQILSRWTFTCDHLSR
jgi:hypothetical protein